MLFYVMQNQMSGRKLSKSSAMAFAMALLYAGVMLILPWELISKSGFTDFDKYVFNFEYYIDHSDNNIAKPESLTSLLIYLVREGLWRDSVISLSMLIGDVPLALHMVSFFILSVSGFYCFKHLGYLVAPLFLLNPSFIDVAMSGLRNGFAWAIVVIVILNGSKLTRLIAMLSTSFLHTSTLGLLALYYSTALARRSFSGPALACFGLAAGAFLGLSVTVFGKIVLGALGDRRGEADYLVGGGSLTQPLIWLILLFLQLTSGSKYISRNIFVISILAWFQLMNPFIPWSYRIWAAVLPLIAISVMDLSVFKRQIFLCVYSGYLIIHWMYWSNLFYYWYPS
jgi:hypothetical protein